MRKENIIRGSKFGKTRYVELMNRINELEEENEKLRRRMTGVETTLFNIKRRREKQREDYGWPQK